MTGLKAACPTAEAQRSQDNPRKGAGESKAELATQDQCAPGQAVTPASKALADTEAVPDTEEAKHPSGTQPTLLSDVNALLEDAL